VSVARKIIISTLKSLGDRVVKGASTKKFDEVEED
jgi:hypothetical protein